MASAVLANRSEGKWPLQAKDSGPKFTGKVPNPNPKKRNFHQEIKNGCQIDDVSPAVTQSAASDDASSINRRPNNDHLLVGNYVSFNVASYSKQELFELKNRLILELEQIRQLKNRIGSQQCRSSLKKSSIPGNKRPFLSNELKKLNQQDNGKLMKSCGQILTKLMKHKHGHIFNSPVDVVGMGLHDYFDIIKNPMDLGTVKSKLTKSMYDSPVSFAADVRLTFNNAMTYNPKIHEVHIIAEQFLARFEELFRPINEKLVQEDVQERVFDEDLPANSWNFHEVKEKENVMQQPLTKSEPMQRVLATGSNPNPKPNPPAVASQMPVRTPSPVRVTSAGKPLKQPKPKAKDPNKREMSMEEKHRLGVGLQGLPQEKMEQVIQILKKRNGNLRQDEDEIELDIEALDTETLWELDRFVTNYKKMISKIKRQALMGINNVPSAEAYKDVPMVEKIEVAADAKKAKKGEAGEEDVDIGDEIPMSSFPPVEIEKDNAHNNNNASSNSSSSSGSSSDSSSSSDSDSGSSSGSDSDADDARS